MEATAGRRLALQVAEIKANAGCVDGDCVHGWRRYRARALPAVCRQTWRQVAQLRAKTRVGPGARPGYVDAGHLQLGYAITGHASQGITIDRSFVLAAPSGPQREWAYVTLSRAKRETRLYVAAPDLELDDLFAPDGPKPLERLLRSLENPAAEPLALRQRRRPEMELEL